MPIANKHEYNHSAIPITTRTRDYQFPTKTAGEGFCRIALRPGRNGSRLNYIPFKAMPLLPVSTRIQRKVELLE